MVAELRSKTKGKPKTQEKNYIENIVDEKNPWVKLVKGVKIEYCRYCLNERIEKVATIRVDSVIAWCNRFYS